MSRPSTNQIARESNAFILASGRGSRLMEQAGSVQDPGQRISFLVSAAYFSNARRSFSPRD